MKSPGAAIDETRAKLLRSVFAMPSPPTMVSRKSTITNAFVCALIPVVEPTVEEIQEALSILGMTPDDVRCAYCGDKFTEWDHLRPLVKNRRPTGYISEIANLVPSCPKCNQSKGNSNWLVWIQSTAAKWSPGSRNTPNLQQRIQRLQAYEAWRPVQPLDFAQIVGPAAWNAYWQHLQSVDTLLATCQTEATKLAAQIAHARHATPRSTCPLRK